jgi:hypothetical protein
MSKSNAPIMRFPCEVTAAATKPTAMEKEVTTFGVIRVSTNTLVINREIFLRMKVEKNPSLLRAAARNRWAFSLDSRD